MNNRLLSAVAAIVLFTGIFTLFVTVTKAECSNLFCSKKQIVVTLKDDANIDIAKDKISKIPKVRIINIQNRDKEWSKMVNKMDLPKMENPFKNEFTIKINRKANIDEISKVIKEMDFVVDVKDVSDTKCSETQN